MNRTVTANVSISKEEIEELIMAHVSLYHPDMDITSVTFDFNDDNLVGANVTGKVL